jgi:hypothetical protein
MVHCALQHIFSLSGIRAAMAVMITAKVIIACNFSGTGAIDFVEKIKM